MTPEAHRALLKSIEHWTRLATANRKPNEALGPHDCALCKLFWSNINCDGCPIKEHTGASGCAFTPYGNAEEAADSYGLDSPEFLAAAQVELDFLKSLLPSE